MNDTDRERLSLAALARHPDDLNALTELAALLHATGRSAAAVHPRDPTARCNNASALMDDGQMAAARDEYKAALRLDPTFRLAHRGLAILYARCANVRLARRHAARAFSGASAPASTYRGTGTPRDVLAIVSALGGNVDVERFLDDRTFVRHTVVAEFYDARVPLPPHDLALNLIGDADRCAYALRRARRLLARTDARTINAPADVLATSREGNAVRLQGIASLRVPRVVRMARRALLADAAAALRDGGCTFPLLLRVPGFQTGLHFVEVVRPQDVRSAVASLPEGDVLAIERLDARGEDGLFRKYRVMSVGGTLYPLHLAVSNGWKVHYYTARNATDERARDEERAFLTDMSSAIGEPAISALEAISNALRLEYCGIDFGLDGAGNVLFFEANATMVVPPHASDPVFAYRSVAVASAERAIRRLLLPVGARGTIIGA